MPKSKEVPAFDQEVPDPNQESKENNEGFLTPEQVRKIFDEAIENNEDPLLALRKASEKSSNEGKK